MVKHWITSTRWVEQKEKLFVSSIYGQEVRRSFDLPVLDSEEKLQ